MLAFIQFLIGFVLQIEKFSVTKKKQILKPSTRPRCHIQCFSNTVYDVLDDVFGFTAAALAVGFTAGALDDVLAVRFIQEIDPNPIWVYLLEPPECSVLGDIVVY